MAWLASVEGDGAEEPPAQLSAADVDAIALLDEAACPASWRPVTAESFAAFPPWKQQRLRDALASGPPAPAYTFPLDTAQTADVSPGAIDWTQPLRGFQPTASGSAPVLLVELADGRAVVLKFVPVVLPELFGTAVLGRLGVATPRLRAVARASSEGRAILRALLQFTVPARGDIALHYANSVGVGSVLHAFRAPFFLLMEFAPGSSLDETGAGAAAERVCDADVQLALGRLMAADIVVNNLDRLPSMVQTRSNVGNIFLGPAGVVAIDNTASWPAPEHVDEALVQQRLSRIAEVTREVRAAPEEEHPEFARVRRLLLSGKPEEEGGWPGLGVDIGLEGSLAVQRGFLQAAAAVGEAQMDFHATLARLEEELAREPLALPSEWGPCVFEELSAVRACPELEPKLRDARWQSVTMPTTGAYQAGPGYCARVVEAYLVGLHSDQ